MDWRLRIAANRFPFFRSLIRVWAISSARLSRSHQGQCLTSEKSPGQLLEPSSPGRPTPERTKGTNASHPIPILVGREDDALRMGDMLEINDTFSSLDQI